MDIILWALLVVTMITLVGVIIVFNKIKTDKSNDYLSGLIKIETLLERLDSVIRGEMSTARTEQTTRLIGFEESLITKLSQIASAQLEQLSSITKSNNDNNAKMSITIEQRLKDARDEQSKRMTEFEGAIIHKLSLISNTQQEQLTGITKTNNEILSKMSATIEQNLKDTRVEQSKRMIEFEQSLITKLSQMANIQHEQLANMTKTNNEVITKMNETVDNKLNDVKLAVENKLKEIQNDNGEKLEKMRQTVDEKLHKTLEERLGQSFKLVSERLEQVHKGLGEMQNLAVGVGDLKKVLSNVRTRGIMGEIQLENILEQILSVEQYERNVCTNPHSRDVVEFAIKLPGKEIDGSIVFLPIDSKFPIEAYYHLQEAYEKANMDEVELARRAIESAIKKSAKDIRDKYIYSPNTTDFGVMFLPIEGLYAEVVRRPQLLEILQREYKIVVTGPTTLAALLNSLQIGFRTLAIEKRSSEVWKILSAVKTEFNKFGVVLEKAQKKITDAGTEIEKLVGTRSKKIIRQLSQVSELKQSEANEILLIETSDDVLEDEEIS